MTTRLLLALLALVPLIAGSVALARGVHGRRVGASPLFVFLFVWSVQLVLNIANPLGLSVPSSRTFALVLSGATAFVVGYAALYRGLLGHLPISAAGGTGTGSASTRPAVLLALVSGVLGSLLFALLAVQLVTAYGPNPAVALLQLRIGLGLGQTPSGFYFFYFLTLFVAVAVVLGRTTKRRLWFAAAGAATVALLATSGRTNAITALVWAVSALLVLRGARRFDSRQIALLGGVLVASLGGFLVLGSALGKTYDNSVFATQFGQDPPVPKALVLPVLYATAPLPTLDAQIARQDRAGAPYNTVRPVLQVGSLLVPRLPVPEKIQEFDFTPYPHNVASYVSPLHRDGGWLGVLLGSWLLGAASGAVFAGWLRRPGPAAAVLVGLVMTLDLASVNDAAFNELSVLFQAALLVLALAAERRSASPAAPALSAL